MHLKIIISMISMTIVPKKHSRENQSVRGGMIMRVAFRSLFVNSDF